jgi:hypothetical protein
LLNLNELDLDWALSHIERFGDTDILPVPFEYAAIRHDWNNVKEYIMNQNIRQWNVRSHRILLSPKARYGFRVITQLDPIDLIVFSAMIHHISNDLEDIRIPTNENVVFSYRVNSNEDGSLFDSNIGYGNFISRCEDILENDTTVTNVVVTDISNFYPNIYIHRLENALRSSNADPNYISAIIHLISGWNGSETFGIPVGSAPTRLLSEVTISDVDSALIANGINFIRFNDDYRIFARSHSEAYRSLAYLAETLNRNHGLSLQQQKTHVLSVQSFTEIYLQSLHDREVNSLHDRFDDLISNLDLEDPYEYIEYEELTDEQRELIDSLNLQEILRAEMNEDEPDLSIVRFILRRLTQLRDSTFIDEILDNIEVLHPAFPDIINYISSFIDLTQNERHRIAGRLIQLFENSIVSELDYHKLWCLQPFAESSSWNQSDCFVQLLNRSTEEISKRKLILALGKSNQRFWFQTQWRNLSNFAPWTKRAVIAGASCMPVDARRHWYQSIRPRLDILEQAITRWATQNPFS